MLRNAGVTQEDSGTVSRRRLLYFVAGGDRTSSRQARCCRCSKKRQWMGWDGTGRSVAVPPCPVPACRRQKKIRNNTTTSAGRSSNGHHKSYSTFIYLFIYYTVQLYRALQSGKFAILWVERDREDEAQLSRISIM